jgi:hypothetical protein
MIRCNIPDEIKRRNLKNKPHFGRWPYVAQLECRYAVMSTRIRCHDGAIIDVTAYEATVIHTMRYFAAMKLDEIAEPSFIGWSVP